MLLRWVSTKEKGFSVLEQLQVLMISGIVSIIFNNRGKIVLKHSIYSFWFQRTSSTGVKHLRTFYILTFNECIF